MTSEGNHTFPLPRVTPFPLLPRVTPPPPPSTCPTPLFSTCHTPSPPSTWQRGASDTSRATGLREYPVEGVSYSPAGRVIGITDEVLIIIMIIIMIIIIHTLQPVVSSASPTRCLLSSSSSLFLSSSLYCHHSYYHYHYYYASFYFYSDHVHDSCRCCAAEVRASSPQYAPCATTPRSRTAQRGTGGWVSRPRRL